MKHFREKFPFFHKKQKFTFLDSASTTQKPMAMIKTLQQFYSNEYANVHRGGYDLSIDATLKFEETRDSIAKFINAASSKEIIFTKNATESINLIATSFAFQILKENDEVLISAMEHHANIIPWQQICLQRNAKLKIIPVNKDGNIKITKMRNLLSQATKIIAITYMSNVFGSIVDVISVINVAKKYGIKTIIDACQAIAHVNIDVQKLDCDFLVFSAHKLYGPTGVGILYGKQALLDVMLPYQVGGAMNQHVAFHKSEFLTTPLKFEAGTPMIAEVIAFKTVLDFLKQNNWQKKWDHEYEILCFIKEELKKMTDFIILGDKQKSIISFLHKTAHSSDIGEILNQQNIAIRVGYHCAQPLMHHLSIEGTARVSLGVYNSFMDAKKFITALKEINKVL